MKKWCDILSLENLNYRGDNMFDNSKLCGRIKEKFGKQENFGIAMGWSHATTTLKLKDISKWKHKEINKAVTVLDIKYDDIPTYFFTLKV